ncbi:MAG TPA: aminodeoxychorismate lyase [Pelomicrobium sp.]|nr:aminodeoxychorismate lyase [Pelomicrobium sp.]
MRFLIDGSDTQVLPATDRGLAYGDGVFRTFRVRQGRARHWELHYDRLVADCAALGLTPPAADLLAEELLQVGASEADAVGKIIITRGSGARGYDPAGAQHCTRLVGIGPMPRWPEDRRQGVRIRVCDFRLGGQPRLAGIKHLNRLENVLARAEWTSPEIAEGLLLDERGRVVEGTMSNVFFVRDGILLTPDLSRCGVAGVQRSRILAAAPALGMQAAVAELTLDDVFTCDELFLVNSVIGLWPVRALDRREWPVGPVTRRIGAELFHDLD